MKRLGYPLPRSIAVVRMLKGLGDMLCAVPALRALRAAVPEARVTLVGLASARAFTIRFSHYIDELAECPGYPGIPEAESRPLELPQFFAAMHEHNFDLAIQLHGNGSITNPFTVLLGARSNAGFFMPGRYCPDEERFLPYPEEEPEVMRHLKLMSFLGVQPKGKALEFPLLEKDREEFAALPEAGDLRPGSYICVHAGASDLSRSWPAERFAMVADALFDLGFPIVLTGDSREKELTQRVAGAMKNRAYDLAGRTTLGALAVLLSHARLLVCNDTGVSHLASALRVPSVVIFTNSDPARWAPLDRSIHRVVVPLTATGSKAFSRNRQEMEEVSGLEETRTASMEGGVPAVAQVLAEAEHLLLKENHRWRTE